MDAKLLEILFLKPIIYKNYFIINNSIPNKCIYLYK